MKSFAIISNSNDYPISLLRVLVVNSAKTACKGRFCNIFYLHAEEQGKTRSSFVGKHLSLVAERKR